MKLKTKVSLILIFLVIAVCSLFAACKIGGESWEEIVGDAKDQRITYYACGGKFKNSAGVKEIYYPAGVPIMTDFDAADQSVTQTDFIFQGWYYVKLDNDGNPVWEDEEKGIPVLTDREVTSGLKLEKGDHVYVGAKWTKDYKIRYKLYAGSPDDADKGATKITVGEKTYNVGDEFANGAFGRNLAISLNYNRPPVTADDATLLEYYVLENGEYVPCSRVQKPEVYDEENPYVDVYCKFVEGVWTMVRDARGFYDMYGSMASGNYYIAADNIDCSQNSALRPKRNAINCKIQGNGRTVLNQKVEVSSLGNGDEYSLFGIIGKDAEIKDITFTGFTFNVSGIGSGRTVHIYLFSHGIEEGAKLENVALTDSTLSIERISKNNATIQNIQKNPDDSYNTDSWIFAEGDYSGVTCDRVTLVIEKETVVVQ
ncbi:MAG: hypothetical protein K2N22_05475 [Clostridia bacterium]|nr:hypothetical protein [Clostridia bacterium]